MPLVITPLQQTHWNQVRDIYLEGIASGHATFETTAPDWEAWNLAHLEACRLVAAENRRIQGWAALTSVSGRCVYGGVGEVSIYVATAARGQGVGRKLLDALVACSEDHGLWTLQAGIFPENTASVSLHAASGFRKVGVRERLGRLQGTWRDVVLMERRSRKTGT